MADTKISALSETLVPSFDDVSPIVVGAATMKVKRRNHHATKRAISEYSNNLATALSTISTTPTTLVINSDVTVNTATVPATITLEFVRGGELTVTTGQTLTILGDIIAGPYKIFDNVMSGQGTVSFAGNNMIGEYLAAWWGVVGDNSTNCNAMLQRITDQFSTDDLGLTLILPPGYVVMSGALVDSAGSSFQWVLPARIGTAAYALTIKGSGPVQMLGYGNQTLAGTILKSTLTTGTGAVIGGRAVGGVSSGVTNLNFTMEDVYVQTVPNPTISGIDLQYVKRPILRNVKVSTGENVDPTEPTNSGSYAFKTPLAWVTADSRFENIVAHGFYNGIEWNELCYATAYTALFCRRAVVVRASAHVSDSGSHLNLIDNREQIVFIEGNSYVNFATVNAEDAAGTGNWYNTTHDVNDPNNYGHGRIGYHLIVPFGVVSYALRVTGGKYLDIQNIGDVTAPYNYTEPFSGFRALNPAVGQIYSRRNVSADTDFSVLLMGADQGGTSNLVALQSFFNAAIGAAEKRIAQQNVATDGATNSGKMQWATWNAGTPNAWMSLDKYGNLNSLGRFAQTEGGVLSVAANTITPTNAIHHVGAGLIKTITLPAGFVSGTVYLIPDAAFTYDNTGNIMGSGTAVVDRIMSATYSSSSSKWFMSY